MFQSDHSLIRRTRFDIASVFSLRLIISSSLWVIIIVILLFGIIWYERFGRDQARTLINQQVASICWSKILWLLLVEVPFIIRFTINKPFDAYFCMAQMTINQVSMIIQSEPSSGSGSGPARGFIYKLKIKKSVTAHNNKY